MRAFFWEKFAPLLGESQKQAKKNLFQEKKNGERGSLKKAFTLPPRPLNKNAISFSLA